MEAVPEKKPSRFDVTHGLLIVLCAVLTYYVVIKDRELSRVQAAYRSAESQRQLLKQPAEKKPPMPIKLTVRRAVLGDGLVTLFHNESQRNLSIVVTCTNPTLKQTENFRLDVAPGFAKELGHMQGWKFASGDVVRVTHNDYEPMEKTMK